MAKTITQRVIFKNASAAQLYSMYLNPKHHSAINGGAKAKIDNKEGAKYSVGDNYVTGRNLQLVKNRLIVQSWRASDWDKSDIDSTFTLLFEQNGADVTINMVHANIPDKAVSGIKTGWDDYYWKPWKKYLKSLK
jgi:activator of HSP90 ATPase